ncbi:MAG: hypothetical protein ACI8S6_002786 [Myxococcota bacterium]|jgi:hypothetical protein
MRLREHLIAALVVAHVAVITFQAIPLPLKIMDDRALERRELRETLQTWSVPLVSAGLLEAAEAPSALLRLNNRIVQVRKAALSPLQPYFYYTGAGQSWRMFSSVGTRSARLQIHLQRTDGGDWEPLYLEHTQHRWRARLLNQERVRTVRSYFSKRNGLKRNSYDRFSEWIAAQAAAEFPEALNLRVRYQKVLIASPAEVRRAGGLEEGEVFWENTHPLGALR